MPATRRRARFRAAFALVATAVISLAASTPAQAAGPVSIDVKVGYSSSAVVKAQQWTPVTIDVANRGPNVEGILEVTAPAIANGPPTGTAIYETPISLPPGANKHLKTYVAVQSASPVTVRIVQNGRVVASADAQPGSMATALIGVLSDQPASEMDNFKAVKPGGVSADVVHLTLDDVGDSAILLRAFDLLAIDDFATDTLTAAQRAAITDYVQNGGALLLGTGASWRKTLAGVSPAILPMRLDSTTTLSSVASLNGVARLEVATGSLSPGARAWLSEGGTPLLAERLVGSGSVNMATFDWNQEPIANWSGGSSGKILLRQILVRTMFSSPSPPTTNMNKFGGPGAPMSWRGGVLSQAIGSLPALDLPSLVVVGLLILAYVLFVGPINYFALRALRRRALAWVTLPLIAIVASAGAVGAGVFTKGRSVQLNQVSILHLQAGWDRAYVESYTGVLTPTRGDYQVTTVGRSFVGPISSFNGGMPGSNTEVLRISADGNTIGMPGMTAFVLRGFGTEGVVDAPHLVGVAMLANGKLTGTIRNDSKVRFTDAVVLAGDGFQLLPALAPGASTTFDFAPKTSNPYGGPPAYTNIYNNYSFTGPLRMQPANVDREAMEKSSILNLIAGANYYGGSSPSIVPMVVAWTKQPSQQIAVGGSQAHAKSETAVVLPLSTGAIGPGRLATGLVMSRFTDIEGTPQGGPPGVLMMQSGSATYDFTPTLAPGAHLTTAALDATIQSPKFGPSQGLFQADVWDWSHSGWMQLDYNAAGTTALPPSAVEPSTGEVRLRLTASRSGNGAPAFFAPISLTGTVE